MEVTDFFIDRRTCSHMLHKTLYIKMNYCRQIFGDPTPHHSIEVFLSYTCSLLHHFCVSPTDFNCLAGAGTWYFQNDLAAETSPLAQMEVSWMRTFEPFDEALSHQPILFLNMKRTAAWKNPLFSVFALTTSRQMSGISHYKYTSRSISSCCSSSPTTCITFHYSQPRISPT